MPKPAPKRTWWGTLLVGLLTLFTIALLFYSTSRGGWWWAAMLAWLILFYPLCAWLGHPVKGPPSSADDSFLID